MEGETAGRNHLPAPGHSDALPTALAAAGAEVNAEWELDGVNLLPVLTGESQAAPHDALYWRSNSRWAIRMGDWKLLKCPSPGAGTASTDGAELYHLGDDLGETNNLAGKYPDRVEALAKKWRAWSEALVAPWSQQK